MIRVRPLVVFAQFSPIKKEPKGALFLWERIMMLPESEDLSENRPVL